MHQDPSGPQLGVGHKAVEHRKATPIHSPGGPFYKDQSHPQAKSDAEGEGLLLLGLIFALFRGSRSLAVAQPLGSWLASATPAG